MENHPEEEILEEEEKSESILEYEEKLRSMGFRGYRSSVYCRTEWVKGDIRILEYSDGKEWDIEHPYLGREDGNMGSDNLDEVLNSFKKAFERKVDEINYSLECLTNSSD